MTRRRTPVIATSITDPSTVHHFVSLKDAVERGGFNQTSVSRCLRNPDSTHCGFKFTTTVTLEPLRAVKRRDEVHALAAKGYSFSLIALELKIARSTVCYHMRTPA
ncbi:MAG: hypothetical protein ACRC8B_22825 [Aeromonas sobria]|uniref:hypothetical protein n=1 Tax=Aeromonas sobria TaxID=646 RepID=UPI003F37859F